MHKVNVNKQGPVTVDPLSYTLQSINNLMKYRTYGIPMYYLPRYKDARGLCGGEWTGDPRFIGSILTENLSDPVSSNY